MASTELPGSGEMTIETTHKGDVSPIALDTAVAKVRHAAERCREPVTRIEVRLVLEPNPARERPAIAEATVDIQGVPVRAHVAAPTIEESIDFMVDRLRRRIQRHEELRHRLADRHRTDGRNGAPDGHSHRPDYAELPYEDREVRRQKAFDLPPMSFEVASFDLEQLGHDFYLFVDDATGQDAIAHHGLDGSIQLVKAGPEGGPVPTLTLTDAKEHLDASGERYVFFLSSETGRGNVLYRRFDGHYGLVTPTG